MNFFSFTFIFIFIFISGTAEAQSTNDCPVHLPRDDYLRALGDSCYVFGLSQERDFQAAEEECESQQGHLVTIKDDFTQFFLYNTLRHDFNYDGLVWIGLSDQTQQGNPHWVWVDGSTATYSHWAHGQLHILGGSESCVVMDVGREGGWYDYRCQGILFSPAQHYFVCEYSVDNPTTTTTTTTAPSQSPGSVPTGSMPSSISTTAGAPSLGQCIQCGDPSSQTSCTDTELQHNQTSLCPDDQPYCMIDIYRESGSSPVKYYKRCADQRSCNWEWYQQYLRSDYCLHLDQNMPDILACHICCVGSGCNTGTVPPADTLFQQ